MIVLIFVMAGLIILLLAIAFSGWSKLKFTPFSYSINVGLFFYISVSCIQVNGVFCTFVCGSKYPRALW